jgi:hypothetical protein
MPADLIVDYLSVGYTAAEIVDNYPDLTVEDIEAAVVFTGDEANRLRRTSAATIGPADLGPPPIFGGASSKSFSGEMRRRSYPRTRLSPSLIALSSFTPRRN